MTLDERDSLAKRFEEDRRRLRSVAYRMLGSVTEAEDAVQEAWLRLGRADTSEVENPKGWLTTVVARVCLDMLRARKSRREEPLGVTLPEPLTGGEMEADPEDQALLADSVGIALLVVLDTLAPAERIAFVLHDTFAVPFDEIARIVGRSPTAARQLASRARRRVQGAGASAAPDLGRQREVVGKFLAALRAADFDGLLAVLDPDVVVRAETAAGGTRELRGAETWARGALSFARFARFMGPALVNGAPGVLLAPGGRLWRAVRFNFSRGRIVEVEVITDPVHLARLELAVLDG